MTNTIHEFKIKNTTIVSEAMAFDTKHRFLKQIRRASGPKACGTQSLRCCCFSPIAMAIRVLPGGTWPRILPRQSESGDPWNLQKHIVLYWFYHQSWLAPIGLFTLVWCHASVFARQGQCESDFGTSTKYAISMSYEISVFQSNVFARQGPVESDFSTSMGHDQAPSIKP